MNNLCKIFGHISSEDKGTVTIDKNKIKVFDICQRCQFYYIREPSDEEKKVYEKLQDYSANLKL